MKTQSRRMNEIPVLFFNQVGARIASINDAGGDVIRLDIGSPDLSPPDFIIDALSDAAIRKEHHGYGSHNGTPALRDAWSRMYERHFAVDLDPETEVLPLIGTKEGIFHLPLAVVDPGDVVLIPDPGYVTYSRGAYFAGAELFFMPLLPENLYLPDLGSITGSILSRAQLLWLNYPNNPTAAVANMEFFEQVVKFARANDLIVCHDAAYCHVTYAPGAAPSIMQVEGALDVAVEFNSLSKSHNMAGWRVGALVGNPGVIRSLFTLKTNADSGHFQPILEAAVTALNSDQGWIDERNDIYRQRRDLVIDNLRAVALEVSKPLASLYVWTPIPNGWTSDKFVAAALENAQVSMTPGTLFGENGEGYVRISLTVSLERMQEAMDRLIIWMDKGVLA